MRSCRPHPIKCRWYLLADRWGWHFNSMSFKDTWLALMMYYVSENHKSWDRVLRKVATDGNNSSALCLFCERGSAWRCQTVINKCLMWKHSMHYPPATAGMRHRWQWLALMPRLTISAVGQARSGTARLASGCICCFSLKERHFLEQAALPTPQTRLFLVHGFIMTFLSLFSNCYVILFQYIVEFIHCFIFVVWW